MSQTNVSRQDISLPNQQHALVVKTQPKATDIEIIKALGAEKPEAVILILGKIDNPDEETQARLFQLFSRGIARAIVENSALVMDHGVDSELMKMLRQALSDSANKASSRNGDNPPPCYIALYNESSDIGTETLYSVAEKIHPGIPILVLLLNGSDATKDEIVRCVRRGWPLLIFEDSGGFAAELYQEHRVQQKRIQNHIDALAEWRPLSSDKPKIKTAPFSKDVVINEVIVDGNIYFFSLKDTPAKLQLLMNIRLKERSVFRQASIQQQMYSQEATRLERFFFRLQNWILGLGVLTTILAVGQSFYKQRSEGVVYSIGNLKIDIVYWLLVIITALVAILIAGSYKFDPGSKWIKLRAASEAFKREMFRYRTHTGIYSDIDIIQKKTTREATLAKRLEATSNQWVKDNLGYVLFQRLDPTQKDKKFIFQGQKKASQNLSVYLSPDNYIIERLEDQKEFFRKRIVKIGRRQAWLQWIILVLGGIATLLAVLQFELAIPIATASTAALINYLEYKQTVNTLKQYKHAHLTLTDIHNWWIGLEEAQAEQDNIDRLVDYVETTLQTEHAGWIQQMQTALTELREQQAKEGSSVPETISPDHKDQLNDKMFQNGQPPATRDHLSMQPNSNE